MKEMILPKGNLVNFATQLTESYKVFSPVDKNGFYVFQELTDPKTVSLDYTNTKIPPKEIFYPRSEVLFNFNKTKDGLEIIEVENHVEPHVILGIRPCDAKAFILLDKFFSYGKYKDPYYLKRRESTILIGLACIDPRSICFCTSLDGSPFAEEGLDIILTDLGDKYLVKSLNAKGDQLLEQISGLESASERDIFNATELTKQALAAITSDVPLDNVTAKLDNLFDEDAFWERFSNKCIGCATCTYLCPTCSCFDVIDEEVAGKGARIRLWDTCQFPLFTKHGSGHNPRPTKRQRLRQRVMHKFSYYPKILNVIGCVGCGRCVVMCPVNQDIRAVFKALQET
ncbi:MAG: 4Fe-4S dicluster domain-containing protein [Candidatus Helarchaeota archaeon]